MLVPVILAGGLGTRLWPVSRPEYPKPLIRLTGDRSLLQETLLRAAAIPDATPPIIVCGAVHYPHIVRQLDEIEQQALPALLEPVGRGTAPAAAVAAMAVEEDDILFVTPADHLVDDMEAFINAIRSAADAARAGWLVTFGVTPDRPETGYGYIERGGAIDDLAGAYRIASFREKPDLATARRYVDGGHHLWNSGMFLFRAGTYLDELRQSNPEIVRLTKESLAAGAGHGGSLRNRGGTLLDPVVFSACPTGSIDRAVMEVTRRGVVVPLEAGWSDLGSWSALWESGTKDEAGNVVTGPGHLRDVSSSYVAAGERPVVVIGLENVVVVDTVHAVLVVGMDHAQQVGPLPDVHQTGSDRPNEA